MRRAWSTKASVLNSGARFLHGRSPIMTRLTRASMSMHRAVRSSPREATRGGSSISSGGCTSWTGRSATASTAGGFCCSASAGQLSRSRASSCWPTGFRGSSAGRDVAKSLPEAAFQFSCAHFEQTEPEGSSAQARSSTSRSGSEPCRSMVHGASDRYSASSAGCLTVATSP